MLKTQNNIKGGEDSQKMFNAKINLQISLFIKIYCACKDGKYPVYYLIAVGTP